jgi:hypothetical protein
VRRGYKSAMLTRLLPLVCAALLAPNLSAVAFRTSLSEQSIGLRQLAEEDEDFDAPRALAEATGGTYSGLVPIGVDQAYIRVQINRAGSLTGVLFVEGQRIPLAATDDGDGGFDVGDLGEVPNLDNPSELLPVSLDLSRDEASVMIGTLFLGELERDFTLKRKPASNDIAGSYSLIFPVPQFDARRPLTLGGTGYARLIVSANGYVRAFGELATGHILTIGAYVQDAPDTETRQGAAIELLALLNPQDPQGTFGGTLRLTEGNKDSDLAGQFKWRFPGRERDGTFRPGLRLFQPVLGSVFTVLDSSDAPIQTTDKGPENVRVKLSGFGLTDAITDVGNNRTGTIDSRTFDLDVHFDLDTGIYEGTCRHPASDRLVRTRGIVYQKTNEVFGLFLHGPGSGTVQVFGK